MALTDDVMFVAGVRYERQRIIKLLTEDGKRNYISQETYDYIVSIVLGTDEEF